MIKNVLAEKIMSLFAGMSVKNYLKGNLGYSNRIINNIKSINGIFINDINQKTNYILQKDDLLKVYMSDDDSENIIPEIMSLDIVYEDEHILLINKPANLVVHPTTYHFTNTLANGVMYYYKMNNISAKFRPVNRLDKDTSGLVLIAKTQISHSILSEQLINKSFLKEYICVVHNRFEQIEGIIKEPIARKADSIIEREVNPNGQEAITKYSVINQNNTSALLRINLMTGRTHQIRVHFSFIGHPLYGDTLYGIEDELISRQALHCHKLEFIHPFSKQVMKFSCDMPDDIVSLINRLSLENNT